MTCAKRTVAAVLFTGRRSHVGFNLCGRPQATCPRKPGEDYTKCRTICQQKAHAEVAAIYQCLTNGDNPQGAHIVVNHDPCESCRAHMAAWDITWGVV